MITNPTHYAVAIEYRPETMAAPVVVAKGRNLLAQRIKQIARWHEIPIVENPRSGAGALQERRKSARPFRPSCMRRSPKSWRSCIARRDACRRTKP